MTADEEQSLSDQHTFQGNPGGNDDSPQSLGDQATFGGGAIGGGDPQSLGDEATFGDVSSGEAVFDDGMELVDLAARYTTEGVLGKGGMGEVLLATDTRLNRKVAIKRILGDAAKSQTAVRRFLTEAQSIAALNHPNIVQIYDYGRAADGPFLIMEYVEGNSLLDKCREGALELEEAVDLTCQLCDGLAKAHDANIIHRDIKPANVLLTPDGVPKLTDFGLAKDETADSGLSVAGAVLGTLDFMPPEQRKDAALTDSRSDLWSLAATLYQMVTGKSPKIIKFNDVPQSLQDVLGKALEDSKDDRYQTARDFRDALRAAQQGLTEVELEEGSCPSCGTKNPTTRKFCRNEACGADLQVACLSCSEKIPMWEGVCDSCGTKQSPLLESRRETMASSQSEAESLLKDFNFDRATELAVALRDEPDQRLQQLKSWAEKFLPKIEQGRQQQLERISGQLKEAAAHEQAHDYAAGMRVLKQVPKVLRSAQVSGHKETAADVLTRLRETLQTIQRLDTEIRQRVENRKLNGLQQEVDELMLLQPDRKDIQKLKQQLVDREAKLVSARNEAIADAKSAMENKEYATALKELQQIDRFVETDEVVRLRELAASKQARVEELKTLIDRSVADKKLHGLLKSVIEYLALKPNDEQMQQLQTRLEARDQKNAAQLKSTLQKAYELRDECQFDKTANVLQRIPENLITEEAIELLSLCESASVLRNDAMTALKKGQSSEDYSGAITLSKEYSSFLHGEMLEDVEFERALKSCKRLLRQQKEAEESERQRKAFQAKVLVGTGALIGLALLVAAGLWWRASAQASALAEAVRQQQWDAALAIDAQHVPALIGRANQRLSSATPDIEGAFADISLAKQVGVTNSEINPVKARAHAKRATSLATEGKIADAEKDLKEAEAMGALDGDLSSARQLLAAAYVTQAEAAVAQSDVAGIRAACDSAERYQAAANDLNRLRAAAFKADGEQKEKSGDLSGAVAALEEAVKLDSSLGLTAERAVLHVKVGEQAAAKQDYQTAATELTAALTLDKSATGAVELAVTVAESVMTAFESDASAENQASAIAAFRSVAQLNSTAAATEQLKSKLMTLLGRAIASFESDASAEKQLAAIDAVKVIESVDPKYSGLPALRGLLITTVIKRGEALVATDLDSSVACYEQALSLGASAVGSAFGLKVSVVSGLQTRCRASLAGQDVAKAAADYAAVAKLDSQAASSLVSDFAKLPASVLSQLREELDKIQKSTRK